MEDEELHPRVRQGLLREVQEGLTGCGCRVGGVGGELLLCVRCMILIVFLLEIFTSKSLKRLAGEGRSFGLGQLRLEKLQCRHKGLLAP